MSERKYHEHANPDSSGSGTGPDEFKKKEKGQKWNVEELESFFREAKLPDGTIKLSKSVMIINTKRFLESHIATVKRHNGNKTFLPYYERLVRFKKLIENGNR